MAVTCPTCGFDENPIGAEFCEACGFELGSGATQNLNPLPPTIPGSSARLIAKQAGSPIPEFTLDSGNAIIGRFDPDTGPVDVDLEGFKGEDTISRNHAEIYQEGGQWKVKDLGSVNGVFIKRSGESRFSARITMPEIVHPGDEIAIAKIRFLFQSP